jgi:hypothetical protein
MNSEKLSILELPALREDNPRDFLAALGLLQWLTLLFPRLSPRLSWSKESPSPRVSTLQKLPDDWSACLWNELLAWRALHPNPFGHGKILDITPAQFRILLQTPEWDDYLRRFHTGLCGQHAPAKHHRRSEFIIESASRSVLSGVDSLLSHPRKRVDFASEIAGNAPKHTVKNTSRWNPAEHQPGAYVAHDPEGNKVRDWVGLNILALFGISFYPVIDTANGCLTPGFRRVGKDKEFTWPVWTIPLDLDSVRSLVLHPGIHGENCSRTALLALGVRSVWRSRKLKEGNNDFYSPPVPAF